MEIYDSQIETIEGYLRKFESSSAKICDAINLLNATKVNLISIKQNIGNTNSYTNLSTLVVIKALYCVVQEVNKAQNEKSEENLAQVVHSAWEATMLMDSFDKEKKFALHYLSNRKTLLEIYKQIILSNSVYPEMLEYYRAVDVFCGTVRKSKSQMHVSSNSDVSSALIQSIEEMPIPNYVSIGFPSLSTETNRYLQIERINIFLSNTLKPLRRIKKSQSITQQEYLTLSTRVVSLALNKVTALINNCNSSPRFQYEFSDFNFAVLEVYTVFQKMSSFDMDENFKKHFDEQKSIIKQMKDRIIKSSQMSSSNRTNNSGCMVMLCFVGGLIISIFYNLVKI